MSGKSKKVSILSKLIPFRQNFYKAQKNSNESPDEWLIRLKELSKACSFGKNVDVIVLDKFITGLESEIIDYLCLSADSLNINTSLDIIHAFQIQKSDPQLEASSEDDRPRTPAQTEVIFSEILLKTEIPSDSDSNKSDHSFIDTIVDDSFEDTFIDDIAVDTIGDAVEEKVGVVPIENTSTDSQFLCSKVENILPEEEEKKQPIKAEMPSTVNATEHSTDTKKMETDSNDAPRPKRKYKKRALKEKRIFECEICHYKCRHECHLRRHKLIHLNQKSFICHMCGKGFNLFINLNAHIRRHNGYKPHVCDICKMSFIDKTRLKLHMRTHTGERPFSCVVCKKNFADRYYLKVHMRLHTGEKPFQCDVCQRSFSQSSSLSTHKKVCFQKTYNKLKLST